MGAGCATCGACPCYEHERKTVVAPVNDLAMHYDNALRANVALAKAIRQQSEYCRALERQLLEARAALAVAEARAVSP